MAYNLDSRHLHRMNINLDEEYEVKVWCYLFNCTSEDLNTAVGRVGTSVKAVKLYLEKKGE
jgi:hypothetical protein